jgi:hypothetical protein
VHILEQTAQSTARATSADDDRNIADAGRNVNRHAHAAVESLDDAYRAVAQAQTITAHLIFAVVDVDLPRTSGAGLHGA